LGLAVGVLLHPGLASAQSPPPPPDATAAARAAFDEGITFVRDARWGEALASFERAHELKPHALTAYNIGVSERALGRLTRARVKLREALRRNDAAGGRELAGSFADDARALLAEMERRLVRVEVEIDRTDAGLSVDGRPLTEDEADKSLFVANLLPPATDKPAGAPKLTVVVDPGRHVFSAVKQGFVPASVEETYQPGSTATVKLSLLQQDTELSIQCEVANAAVRVDGVDVGLAPLVVRRPAGKHAVDVRAANYQLYSTAVELQPGERSTIVARLRYEETSIFKRPVFWIGLGVSAIVIGGLVTYALLPSRPLDGGNTGWVAQPR